MIAAFFKYLDYINDSVWRHLVRILVNRLYLDSPRSGKKAAVPTHDFISQVLLLGQKNEVPEVKDNRDNITPSANKEGIRFIIELYKRSRSIEARDNLFHVIFDYIHYCYRRMVRSNPTTTPKDSAVTGTPLSQSRPTKLNVPNSKSNESSRTHREQPSTPSGNNKTPTSAQFSVILEILTRIDAPQYFACIFKFPPPNFVNHVLGLISHVSNTSHNNDMSSLLAQADPIILRRVLKDFSSLAELTLRIAPSFAEDCTVLLAETSDAALLNASLKSISSLVQGKASAALIASSGLAPQMFQFERLQGAQWMQQLLQIVWNVRLGLSQVPPVEIKKHVPPPTIVTSSDSSLSASVRRPRKESAGSITSSSATTASTAELASQNSGGQHVPIARRLSDTKSSEHTSRRTSREGREPREGRVEKELKERDAREKDHSHSGSRDNKDTTRERHHSHRKAEREKDKEHKDKELKEVKEEETSKDGEHSKEHKDHKEHSKEHKEHKEHKVHTHKDNKDHVNERHASSGSSSSRHHHHASAPKISPVNLSLISPTLTEMPSHMLPTKGLHLRTADAHFVDTVESAFFAFVKSSDPLVRRSYLRMVEAGMYYIVSLSDQGASSSQRSNSTLTPSTPHTPTSAPTSPLPSPSGATPMPLSPSATSGTGRSPRTTGSLLLDSETLTRKAFELLNTTFLKLIKVGQESTESNLQLMFDIIVEFVMFIPSSTRSETYKSLMRTAPLNGFVGPNSPASGSNGASVSNGSSNNNVGGNGSNHGDDQISAKSSRASGTLTTPIKDKIGTASGTLNSATATPHGSNRGHTSSPSISIPPISTATVSGPHPPLVKSPRGTSADSVLAQLQYNLSDSDESFGSDDLSFGAPSSGLDGRGNSHMGASGTTSGGVGGVLQSSSTAGVSSSVSMSELMASPPSPQLERLGLPASVPESSSRAIDMMDLNSQDDSPAGLFMRGLTDMVRPLLELIHIDILLHLFANLPPRMNSATRPVVLHFLTERCKRSTSDLEIVGGSSFFKKLLTENDPLIS